MLLPLYYFLLAYFLFLLIFIILAYVNLSHITRTGSITFVTALVTFALFSLTALILFATWYFLRDVDWQTPVQIWDSNWIPNLSGNDSPTY